MKYFTTESIYLMLWCTICDLMDSMYLNSAIIAKYQGTSLFVYLIKTLKLTILIKKYLFGPAENVFLTDPS